MPSVTVNTSIPDEHGIPQPTKSKVSSTEAGVSNSVGASTAATYTVTPQQIADFLIKYGWVTPAMGPQDELPPIVRTLQSGVGTVGQHSRRNSLRSQRHRRRSRAGCSGSCWSICALMETVEPRPLASWESARASTRLAFVAGVSRAGRRRASNSRNHAYRSRTIVMDLGTFIRMIDKTSGHRQGAAIEHVDAIAADAEVTC